MKRCQLPAFPFRAGRDPWDGVNPRLVPMFEPFEPRLGVFAPRFELLKPGFEPLNPRFGVFARAPVCPERGSNERVEFPEFGGVNVCQPGREEVIGVRPGALAKPLAFPAAAPEGWIARPPRLASNGAALRAVLIGRAVELNPPRAATLVRPTFARFAVKKCCDEDGACR